MIQQYSIIQQLWNKLLYIKFQEDHPTYDPEKHCLNNPVIIIKNGLKPSKRKEHRQKQRQKLRDFKTGASQANDSKFNELSSASNASSSGMVINSPFNVNCIYLFFYKDS